MKLLLDEMWSPAAAQQLREAGHDVSAVVERRGLVGSRDTIILRVAVEEQRALVTEDVGFRPLVAGWYERGGAHSGLILTSDRAFPRAHPRTTGRLVRALHNLLLSGIDLTNAEHWLQPPDEPVAP